MPPSRRISLNSNDQVSVSYAKCTGNESTLQHCKLEHSGRCESQERAGVICQVLNSCAALKSAGVLESGVYTIDPDGLYHGEDPFPVECDMQSEKATGVTIVGHDAEERERVSPCENAGCYTRNVTYKSASLEQLKALTSVSESCEQFVKLECRHIRFLKEKRGWWVSSDGQKVNSWGGASTNSGKCACGEKGTCALGLRTCNCDANDGVWRKDEGLLTDKSTLPIQAISFGGTQGVPVEMAFHSLGKLRCSGNSMKLPILQSCAALKDAGYTDSGFYSIDPDGNGQGFAEFEAYCDMTSDPTTGITEVSHDSENRIRVTPCEEAGCYHRELQYGTELAQLNALAKVSDTCEQYVRLDCRHIRFIQSGWGWWVSWNGEKMFYWGGADRKSKGCACGMTGSCAGSGKLCNCDNNDHIWRRDDGYLRDKQALPVKAVHLGDTQDPPLEMAYHTIGKLRCRGRGSAKNYQRLISICESTVLVSCMFDEEI
ncbi:neurexin-4-like [Lissotriton helveticus]